MKQLLTAILVLLFATTFSQDKNSYVHYNKLTEVKGTNFIIASIENLGKMLSANSKYLLFVNTKTGQAKQIDFPKGAFIQRIEQIKLDSLGINKIIVAANTVNLDRNKSIDWNDPLCRRTRKSSNNRG